MGAHETLLGAACVRDVQSARRFQAKANNGMRRHTCVLGPRQWPRKLVDEFMVAGPQHTGYGEAT